MNIVQRIVLVVASAVALFTYNPQPAQAYDCALGCAAIRHHAPDDGFDAPFIVRAGGFDAQIPEGSARGDVLKIYVPAGEQIVCTTDGVHYFIQWDATGWYTLGQNFGRECVNQLD